MEEIPELLLKTTTYLANEDYYHDHLVWKWHNTGKITVDSTWDLIKESRPPNSLHHLLMDIYLVNPLSSVSFLDQAADHGHVEQSRYDNHPNMHPL
ncbi:LOW QUALITY PROTEIN: hypothetical protein NC652_029487 [Populus alba x Populus x berolinensis]|nr:LOW QUALITY PROTEIN: hypothetical protein NC652_029487 [Populus alba x Populus x berolinensis]